MAKDVNFVAMNGLGNKILVVDMRGRYEPVHIKTLYLLTHKEKFRADQILSIRSPQTSGTDYYIEIMNKDGSYSGTCGNGMRCLAKMLGDNNPGKVFVFETAAGILSTEKHPNGFFSVDMGTPCFHWKKIPLSKKAEAKDLPCLNTLSKKNPLTITPHLVSTGNPHAIFYVPEDPAQYPLEDFGPHMETHPIFPERANISLAKIVSEKKIMLRTWERGAGLTPACASGACAATVCAAHERKTDRTATVKMPGGELLVEWKKDNHMIVTGPAEEELRGVLNLETGQYQLDPTRGLPA